jgi:hypothetical protein
MSRLEIKRLDSPLSRSSARSSDPAEAEPQPDREREPQPDREPAPKTPRPKRQPSESTKPRLASVPPTPPQDAAKPDPLDDLPDPPHLNESLELLSTRLPTSLRRSLADLTAGLRTRTGKRMSQKALPEQEVLAVLIWLAGSAENAHAVAQLGTALDAYRARRYAAAAAALRPSPEPGESSTQPRSPTG